ncbi:hypothetical protein ABPG75_006346 [Micractinium tetrahymenae]
MHGMVFVVGRYGTLQQSAAALRRMLLNTCLDELHGLPLLVLANMQDLPTASSVEEVEEHLGLRTLWDPRPWRVQGCCCNTGQGLLEGLRWLAEAVAGQLAVASAHTRHSAL